MMAKSEAKVVCRTPTPGKQPTRISRWRYDVVRKAILRVVPKSRDGIPFAELPMRVARQLGAKDLRKLGSVNWYTTTVKLEMEVRGELERVPGLVPQRLRRV